MDCERGKRSVAVIGAGLHGLITAKTLIHDSNNFFDDIVVYEKNYEAGGVWAHDRIYEGLTTNSPLLTYEIPGFPFPEALGREGVHVKAQDVRKYLHDYAKAHDVQDHLHFNTEICRIAWSSNDKAWAVDGRLHEVPFHAKHTHIVICTGLYHTSHSPLKERQTSTFEGNVWHSSQIGSPFVQRSLAESKDVMIIGAGKSALDISTLIAKGVWQATPDQSPPSVTLVYRKPHWIAPRKIIRGSIAFERLLFSRFVNAWLPYVYHVDWLHFLVAETRLGKLLSAFIFWLVADDFIKSNSQQRLTQTIPEYPLSRALSGALHVEPPGYLDLVNEGKISILQGNLHLLHGKSGSVKMLNGENHTQNIDTVILATGYKLALPFFDMSTLENLGLIIDSENLVDTADLAYIHLYRLIVPPKSLIQISSDPAQPRNIAFNGFAYSLLNPTVAHVTAHWIADYFSNQISIPHNSEVKNEIRTFHNWQTQTFGAHGEKGVHIGNHATLYTDTLLGDMGLMTGHVDRKWWQINLMLGHWFRPMLPHIYSEVGSQRQQRDDHARCAKSTSKLSNRSRRPRMQAGQWVMSVLGWMNAMLSLFLGLGMWMVGDPDGLLIRGSKTR